jgi:predicted transcriptional regulator
LESHHAEAAPPFAVFEGWEGFLRLTPLSVNLNLEVMEVRLDPDLQAKLAQLASKRGRDSEELVVDAVERMVNFDQWLMREVERGISAADRGELVDHEDVRKLIDRRYPG